MDPRGFTKAMPGQLVEATGATPDVSWAFIPDPLPPAWKWPEHLWPLLLEARIRLASLDGTGKHLPNPEILLQPLQNREAQLSSQLEGTVTNPQQQALFKVDPKYPVSNTDPVNAFREVFNYGRALRLRLDGGVDLPLSQRLIRQLHAVLMDGVRGSDHRPGEFRTTQNQIGRPARFVPPPPQYLGQALDAFEKHLHVDDGFDPLVRSFLAHYQFEAIHPFSDGNGRVGRLLLSLTIAEWCGLSGQWLYMSPFFEKRKEDYMDLLLRVSTHADWESWIRFCLEGVIIQAKDTEQRCEKLLSLHRDFHARLKGGSIRLGALIDHLFNTPVISVVFVKNKFRVTYPTARSDLKKLEALGVVQQIEHAPRLTYYCRPIYEVAFEDAATDGLEAEAF